MCACACVRACVRVCVCASVCVCVRTCVSGPCSRSVNAGEDMRYYQFIREAREWGFKLLMNYSTIHLARLHPFTLQYSCIHPASIYPSIHLALIHRHQCIHNVSLHPSFHLSSHPSTYPSFHHSSSIHPLLNMHAFILHPSIHPPINIHSSPVPRPPSPAPPASRWLHFTRIRRSKRDPPVVSRYHTCALGPA